MRADILSIGDELLNGQTVNTNAAWMAQRLNDIGIGVRHIINLSDKREDILATLKSSLEKCDIVLITGGLGPTSDDITRDVLCEYFSSELEFDEKVLKGIEMLFKNRKRIITDEVKDLAMVPTKAKTIYNYMGTAPGTIFTEERNVVVSMPGVPYEMKNMMKNDILPYLKRNFELPVIMHRHILTAGVGESKIASKLKDVEVSLPSNIGLAYLPSVGKVNLRLTASGNDKSLVESSLKKVENQVLANISKYVYGFDNDLLEKKIGDFLLEKGLTIGTAESCTGGYIGHLITLIAGSSKYFKGGVISYANQVKEDVLGVEKSILETEGAVSEPTVEQMINGAIKQLDVDIAIAASGVAGPTGGTPEKPVGTVYIGIGTSNKKYIRKIHFTPLRDKNIQMTGVVALVMLRKFLLENY